MGSVLDAEMGLYIDNPYTAKYSDNAGPAPLSLSSHLHQLQAEHGDHWSPGVKTHPRNVVCRLSTHDRCEEYCMLQVSPLARDWGITLKEDEEQHGLP